MFLRKQERKGGRKERKEEGRNKHIVSLIPNWQLNFQTDKFKM